MNKRIVINGLSIFYQEHGKGKQTILLLHGWGQSHAFWKDVIEKLSSNYQVYVVDLPGFGRSDVPMRNWTLKSYAIFVNNFVKTLNIYDPIVFGHSFGGRIAIVYASRFPIKKLILYSNGGLPVNSLKQKASRSVLVVLGQLGKYLAPNLLYKAHTVIYKPKQYENKIIINKKRSRRMLDIYALPVPNLKTDLKNIRAKTLIFSGKKDFIAEANMGKRLHALIKNSYLVEIPNATHFAHLETPRVFYKELDTFLNS